MPNQKYAPPPLGQSQAEDSAFEYKPLDLSGLKRANQDTRVRRKKKVIVPCPACGTPGCQYETTVDVDEED